MRRITKIILGFIIFLALAGCSGEAPQEARPPARGYTSAGTPIIYKSDYEEASQDPWDIPLTSTPDSTCFSEIGWKDETLVVVFRESGAVYCYLDVPRSVWREFKDSESLGGYYNKNIKGSYECEKMSP